MSITEALHPGQGAPLISQINTASVNVTHIDAYIQTFSPVDDQKQIKLQIATKQGLYLIFIFQKENFFLSIYNPFYFRKKSICVCCLLQNHRPGEDNRTYTSR